MVSRSSHSPATGAYSWSPGWMRTDATRGGAPGSSPVSGCPCPRLHHAESWGVKPRLCASAVTKMTPVRGTVRKAATPLSLDMTPAHPTPPGGAISVGGRLRATEAIAKVRIHRPRVPGGGVAALQLRAGELEVR